MKRRYESLAAYLKATGTTQEQLAEAVGVRQGLISKYVRGQQTPRLALALKLSKHTGVPLEALTAPLASDADRRSGGDRRTGRDRRAA